MRERRCSILGTPHTEALCSGRARIGGGLCIKAEVIWENVWHSGALLASTRPKKLPCLRQVLRSMKSSSRAGFLPISPWEYKKWRNLFNAGEF
jgi:hypothetical protein